MHLSPLRWVGWCPASPRSMPEAPAGSPPGAFFVGRHDRRVWPINLNHPQFPEPAGWHAHAAVRVGMHAQKTAFWACHPRELLSLG